MMGILRVMVMVLVKYKQPAVAAARAFGKGEK